MPTILLLGGGGQLGRELREPLSRLGRVLAPSRAQLDITDGDALVALVRQLQPALIVNAAAYTAVDRAESDVETCVRVNETAPGVLGRAASLVGAAVVHFSTDYVFDGALDRPYREADAPNPLNVYGRTKLAGERALADSGAPYLVLRTSWLFGRHGENFVNAVLRLARSEREIRMVDDQVGAPTWTRALAIATGEALERLTSAGRSLADSMGDACGVYHVAATGATSRYGFAQAVIDGDPKRSEHVIERLTAIRSTDLSTPAVRPLNSRLDCSAAAARLGMVLPCWSELVGACLASS